MNLYIISDSIFTSRSWYRFKKAERRNLLSLISISKKINHIDFSTTIDWFLSLFIAQRSCLQPRKTKMRSLYNKVHLFVPPWDLRDLHLVLSSTSRLTGDISWGYFPSRQPHEKCEHNDAGAFKKTSRVCYSTWRTGTRVPRGEGALKASCTVVCCTGRTTFYFIFSSRFSPSLSFSPLWFSLVLVVQFLCTLSLFTQTEGLVYRLAGP